MKRLYGKRSAKILSFRDIVNFLSQTIYFVFLKTRKRALKVETETTLNMKRNTRCPL